MTSKARRELNAARDAYNAAVHQANLAERNPDNLPYQQHTEAMQRTHNAAGAAWVRYEEAQRAVLVAEEKVQS